MQSSPPTRALERPSSRAESEYSLDLDALDLETQSDIDIPKQKVDRIFSEDIDGPSDFTQNMEMWMRGGPASRKSTLKGLKQSTTPIQEVLEKEKQAVKQQEHLQVPTQHIGSPEHEHTGSHHTPDNSPPNVPAHHQTETIEETEDEDSVHDHTGYQDGFSSEWQTYGSASTPAPPPHKQFLQPTVEDYNSELSPARHAFSLKSRGRSLRSSGPRDNIAPPEKEPSTPGRASSPTLSPVRSPLLERSKTGDDRYDKEMRNDMEEQMMQLQAKWQQLEHLNQALEHALDEEKRQRKEDQISHEAQMAEASRREKDLADMKEAAYQHSDDFRREFGELKKKLQDHDKDAENAKAGESDSERDFQAELQRLKDRLELQQMQHTQETRGLKQDLELASKSREIAEETARIHREELEEQRSLHDAEVGRLRADLKHSRADEATIMGLERRLNDSDTEIKRLKALNVEQETELMSTRSQLASAKQSREDETSRLSSARGRAVELASNLQRQLQELRQQLKDEQASHETDLERLRSQQEQSSQTSVRELEIVRGELETKQTELNEAILERDEAKDAFEFRQSEEESLRNEVADMKAVNAELDARITEKLQRRETYWREKLEEADRERQLMAKALLHHWGREEVGIDSPQMYAYKYLRRADSGKTPTKTKAAAQ
ncbi:Hypothetical predicted protein [Lecanosticta acicola]|uniref:Uncharacterized protein n=1 Tax=Lecanosticta acicola TaxID=111012 RepID=A0AAI9E7J0_9PEZI|nr:Hypothetical predicted protein [Lecanosticta acicola]